MNITRALLATSSLLLLLGVSGIHAQQTPPDLQASLKVKTIDAQPASLSIQVGDTVPVTITLRDADGNAVNAPLRVTGVRGALLYLGDRVTATTPGDFELVATVVMPPGTPPLTLDIPVEVTWPAITRVDVKPAPGRLYVGTTLAHRADALHANGTKRPNPTIGWQTSDASIATVDRFGFVTAHAPGSVTITASAERGAGTVSYAVQPFTGSRIEASTSAEQVRTGDVVKLDARVLGANGPLTDVPVTWSFTFTPDDSIRAPGAAGLIRDNAFVGEVPGRYTLIAASGPLNARRTIDVRPREAIRQVTFVGQGSLTHERTSDLWIYEGVDGRDYGVTGTWGASGQAFFWDVTDPANIIKTDSVKIDARTVNDVKVSPDGRYAVLSREGASNRRNGLVIMDLSNPAHPTIASTYDEGLTGGVHNVFATNDYLFALSAGDKYVILDVRDLKNPKFVSEYNHPDSRIHDVWVHDGFAYSSEWGTGTVIVDVGNGKYGGSIENPKFVTAVPYPVGANHAAFPYYQESTGKFYLFLGDEMGRRGYAWTAPPNAGDEGGMGTPETMGGYLHVIDFTDPFNPKDVARYEVKEFGTHNLWVQDDILYQAYYDGGVRMLDVSGELMGDLAEQGREIAVFKSFDPEGFVKNGVFVWGAQPYKGHIFFSDHYSGLWSAKLQPKPQDAS